MPENAAANRVNFSTAAPGGAAESPASRGSGRPAPSASPSGPGHGRSHRVTSVEAARHDAMQLLLAFGPAFASSGKFWRSMFYSLLLGCFMGVACIGFFNGFTYVFDLWTTDEYEDGLKLCENMSFMKGKYLWVCWTTLGGLIVGLIKLHPWMPANVDGLFREVRDLSVEPSHVPLVFLSSCVSLAAGASVGPEAALGNLGGGVGTLVARWRKLSDRRSAIAAFVGMSGAMGALIPSPFIAVLLMHELSVTSRPGDSRLNAAVTTPLVSYIDGVEDPATAQHDFMEQISLAGVAAAAGFAVFKSLQPLTYLGEPKQVPFALFEFSQFEIWHIPAAVPLGIVGGIMGIFALVVLGASRKICKRVSDRLINFGTEPWMVKLAMPALGGFLIGVIGVMYPLTLGDGTAQLSHVIKNSFDRTYTKDDLVDLIPERFPFDPSKIPDGYSKHIVAHLSWETLIGTAFLKLIAMGISLGFGFVGGQIFPTIFAGTCAGCAISRLIPGMPISLTVPCMMAAVPGSFAPIPFSLVGLVVVSLVLDGDMAAPVFVATFTAFLTNCGFGVVQRVLERQNGLSGVMTTLRNNNNHSGYYGDGESRISFNYGVLEEDEGGKGGKAGGKGGGKGGDEHNTANALVDVSDIIFAAEPSISE